MKKIGLIIACFVAYVSYTTNLFCMDQYFYDEESRLLDDRRQISSTSDDQDFDANLWTLINLLLEHGVSYTSDNLFEILKFTKTLSLVCKNFEEVFSSKNVVFYMHEDHRTLLSNIDFLDWFKKNNDDHVDVIIENGDSLNSDFEWLSVLADKMEHAGVTGRMLPGIFEVESTAVSHYFFNALAKLNEDENNRTAFLVFLFQSISLELLHDISVGDAQQFISSLKQALNAEEISTDQYEEMKKSIIGLTKDSHSNPFSNRHVHQHVSDQRGYEYKKLCRPKVIMYITIDIIIVTLAVIGIMFIIDGDACNFYNSGVYGRKFSPLGIADGCGRDIYDTVCQVTDLAGGYRNYSFSDFSNCWLCTQVDTCKSKFLYEFAKLCSDAYNATPVPDGFDECFVQPHTFFLSCRR